MPMTDPSSGNGRQKTGNALIYICAIGLIVSATLKFAHVPKVVAQMSSMGYEDGKLVLVAGLELISALLFLVQSTRSVGLLIISAFLGGAIASHVAASQFLQVLPPSVFLFLTWFGSWLRHPEVLWSWSGQTGPLPARREIAGSL